MISFTPDVLTAITLKPALKNTQNQSYKDQSPNPKRFYWWLVFIIGFGLFAAFNIDDFDFLIFKDGKYDLSPERKIKLEKELREIDEAEQYVIFAQKPGNYPCYNCGDRISIYLNSSEVWKYGITRVGQTKRYSAGEIPKGLEYQVEFRGDYASCLKLEKIKIYHYALLPENLARNHPLIRPPGNRVDL